MAWEEAKYIYTFTFNTARAQPNSNQSELCHSSTQKQPTLANKQRTL